MKFTKPKTFIYELYEKEILELQEYLKETFPDIGKGPRYKLDTQYTPADRNSIFGRYTTYVVFENLEDFTFYDLSKTQDYREEDRGRRFMESCDYGRPKSK